MSSPEDDTKPTLAQVAHGLLDSVLNNIIHDTIIQRHREHKLMLMHLDPTTKLPHCERCNLPRLLDPPLAPAIRGTTSNPPADTNYCEKKPWCRKPGYDIYGNPFLKADLTGRPPTKKEREAAKNSKNDGTPASNDDGTAPPSPTAEDGDKKLEKGEKKASKIDEKLRKGEYIPWQTCPNCKRSLLITRFAKHLEQCMGLSGRQASRNAMAKMNGSTPAGSRGGTPVPESSQGGNGGGDEDDEDDKVKAPSAVRKKLLKKGLNNKSKSSSGGSKGNTSAATTNGTSKPFKRPPISSGGSGDGAHNGDGNKRDFSQISHADDGDDDDNVHVKKRQKLQRVGSMTSIASASTAAAAEMERGESQDGSSFVGEDLSFGDD